MPDTISYKKSFVAFLDVLGFKNLVKSNKLNQINMYFSILKQEINRLKSIDEKTEIGYIVISDSIIMTIPLDEHNVDSSIEERTNKLRQLCIAIGFIQQRLALHNIWLRGAIACGDTYFNQEDMQVVGPAYIDAFLLEQEKAKYPRVIIDSKVIQFLNYPSADALMKQVNTGPKSTDWHGPVLFNWRHQNGVIVQEIVRDVPLFIDYLSPFFLDSSEVNLQQTIKNIENTIYKSTNLYEKYRWLLDYMRALEYRNYCKSSSFNQNLYNKLLSF